MPETICLGCSCLCDDLEIDTNAKGELSVTSNCKVAEDWIKGISKSSNSQSQIAGEQSNHNLVIQRTAELLSNASSPLITGLKGCSSQTVRTAIQLAEKLGAYIDPLTGKSDSHRLKALNQHGGSTCSLGEVSQRADLILFWGDSIVEENPCLLDVLKLERSSLFLTNGRKDRHLVSITRNPKQNTDWCNEILDFSNQSSTEVLSAITSELQKEGASQSEDSFVSDIAKRIREAQYPVLIFDAQLAVGEEETAWNALAKLVAVANEVNRMHTVSISAKHASHMAESVLSWQTGYSRCLNFSTGHPEYNLDLWSTEHLLSSGQIDVCVFIGDIDEDFIQKDIHLSNKNFTSILISPDDFQVSNQEWDIAISTSRDGVHNSGTFLRFDHVPLPARRISESALPSLEDALSEISSNIK